MTSTRSAYHHGDLAGALVEEATAQVAERGADSVSLRKIATTLGVSPSAAYHHFPDKDALLSAVGSSSMERLDETMRNAVEAVRGRSDRAAVQRFRAAGGSYVTFALQQSHLFRIAFGPLCAKEPTDDPSDNESFAILVAIINDLDARQLLKPGIREGLEFMLWTSVHGFASLALEGLVPVEAAEMLLDSLGNLILNDPSLLRR